VLISSGQLEPQQQKRAEPGYLPSHCEAAPLYCRLFCHTPGASSYAPPSRVIPSTLTPSSDATALAWSAVDMANMPDCEHTLLCA
jgi:hypothetical protein